MTRRMFNRRTLFATAFAAGAAQAGAQTPAAGPCYIELRQYRLRTDHTEQSRRTTQFLTRAYLPAAKRAGATVVGLFNASVGPETPFITRLTSYPSAAAMEAAAAKLLADADYQKALADYDANPDAAYIRMDSWLLRSFDSFPVVNAGPSGSDRPARAFELRTYESQNESTMRSKIKMFESGEVAIFRASGMEPIFFGNAVAGSNLPHVTYMLAYNDASERDKAWTVFRANADWLKLQRVPEFAAPGLVINVSNAMLTPIQGSDIR